MSLFLSKKSLQYEGSFIKIGVLTKAGKF